LEAMQEKQVTLEGKTHSLKEPFIVIATQNPIELEGTYPLPEAQLDRFTMKMKVGYLDTQQETEMLKRRLLRKSDDINLNQVADPTAVIEMQKAVEQIHVDDDILHYIAEIVQATRNHPRIDIGASPRGSLAILKLSRAHAFYDGRDYVTPDDVKNVAIPALCHRIIFKTEYWFRGISPESVIQKILTDIPVPKLDGNA